MHGFIFFFKERNYSNVVAVFETPFWKEHYCYAHLKSINVSVKIPLSTIQSSMFKIEKILLDDNCKIKQWTKVRDGFLNCKETLRKIQIYR